MTTGAPIYLVSACTSGEEFVSAFRRYADRNGVVFVPIADPLPSGRKGRFALTLRDGGVMIDGEAEVVSSARTPSVLYGRVGMTMKFVSPDEPSKTMLAELEKARLALKPAPPTIAPRPADVPSEPRPKPPPPSGRIDAINALAECVAIGDVEPLPARPDRGTIPPLGGIPAIPRPGRTTPPPLRKPPAIPTTPAAGLPARPPPRPATPPSGVAPRGQRDDPTLRAPAPAAPMPAAPVPAGPPVAAPPVAPARPRTPAAPLPAVTRPAAPIAARPSVVREDEDEPTDLTSLPEPSLPALEIEGVPVSSIPRAPDGDPRRTAIGVAVVPGGELVPPAAASGAAAAVPTAGAPTTEPSATAPSDEIATAPTMPAIAAVQVEESTPSGDWTMIPGATGPTITPTPREPKKEPKRPTGNWVIALDPTQPDGWTEPSKLAKRPEGEQAPGPPVSAVAGEAALDSDARVAPEPDDAAEPKVQIDPTLIEPLQPMPVDDLDAAADSSPGMTPNPSSPNISPLGPPLPLPHGMAAAYHTPVPGSLPMPGAAPVAMPGVAPMPSGTPVFGATPGVMAPMTYPTAGRQRTAAAPIAEAARRRRLLVIAASAAAAVVIGILLVISLGGGSSRSGGSVATDSNTQVPDDTPAPKVGEGTAASAPVEVADAGIDPDEGSNQDDPPEDDELVAAVLDAGGSDGAPVEPAGAQCQVEVTTAPVGATVVVGKSSLGTTPTTIALPCDQPTRVVFKRSRYLSQARTITATADSPKPVRVTMPRATFSVKVSSSPAGATIKLGSRTVGVTPTTVKLPAYRGATLRISKNGFVTQQRSITPKQNNRTVHVALKRARR